MNFTEKYKPKSLKEIYGQDLTKLKTVINGKKPILIFGNSGTGKTVTAYALGKDLGYEIIEVNASDKRNKEQIEKTIGNALKQESLFNKGKLILIDEVDGITGREDRGGVQTILRLIKDTKHLVILTSNDPYISKLSSLRRKCELIEFKDVDYLDIFEVLKKISEKEGIKVNDDVLKVLSARSKGDLRGAIINLESLGKDINKKDLEDVGEREKKEDILNVLNVIFKSKNVDEGIFMNLNEDLNEVMLWIDENLGKVYFGKDLVNGYEKLSKADVFNGRIRKRQYWRLLSYVNFLLSKGIALSKKDKVKGFLKLKRNERILKLWLANRKYGKKKNICRKIGLKSHSSVRKVMRDFEFYKTFINDVKEEVELDEDEIEWVNR